MLKRTAVLITLIAMLAALHVFPVSAGEDKNSEDTVIIYTNDVHCGALGMERGFQNGEKYFSDL